MGAAFTIVGVNPKQRCIAFTELQPKLNRSKIFPCPTKTPSTSPRCSHILREGAFLLPPYLDTVPEAEGSKSEGRQTRQHCSGGTGVPEAGRGRVKLEEYEYRSRPCFSVAYRHHSVK